MKFAETRPAPSRLASDACSCPLATVDATKSTSKSDLQPAEATATLSELDMPLANLIRDTAHAVVEALGLEQKDVLVEGLATRWQRGTLVIQPAERSLQPKEIPL